MVLSWHLPKDPFIVLQHLLDVLLGLEAHHSLVVPKEVTTKVVRDRSRTLQLEVERLSFELINDRLGVLADDGQVVDVHTYVLVEAVFLPHPYIRLRS